MKNQTAIEWLDRIIDEDSHVYKKEALEALDLGKKALETIDEMQTFIKEAREDLDILNF